MYDAKCRFLPLISQKNHLMTKGVQNDTSKANILTIHNHQIFRTTVCISLNFYSTHHSLSTSQVTVFPPLWIELQCRQLGLHFIWVHSPHCVHVVGLSLQNTYYTARFLLTSARLGIQGVQGIQIHINYVWCLDIPKMLFLSKSYDIQILLFICPTLNCVLVLTFGCH